MPRAVSDQQHQATILPEEPLVSVIIPVYNGELLIGQTIDSALRQTYQNMEIIVVDDASTDRTPELVEAYTARDSRVRLIRQPHSGVARARNRALAEARGEFIAPLDADDLWEPNKIAMQVARMLQAADAGMVYSWWVWIDTKGAVLDRSPGWLIEGEATLPTLLQVNYTGNASVPLYRRRCMEEVGGYDEDLVKKGAQGCEDWDLALKVAARYPVAVVPAILTGYRRAQGRMSMNHEAMLRSQTLVAEGVRGRVPLSPSVFQRSADQFALYIAGGQFWSGAYLRALWWTLRSWQSGLLFAVLPYLLRVLCGRLLGRRGVAGQVMTPGLPLDSTRIPGPLIPYDRIYARLMPQPPSKCTEPTPSEPRDYPAALAVNDRVTTWLQSPFWQGVAIVIALLTITLPHFQNDGLWFGGDAPRHAANGLFWWDLLELRPASPMDFARSYYARYPAINPVAYPPLFYILEGLGFHLFGPSPLVPKFLVFLFAAAAALYTMAWARRWLGSATGWVGAFVVFIPGIVGMTNSVMLNVPSTALVVGALYHFRRWSDDGSQKQLSASILSASAAALTYYQGGIAVCVCLVWAFLFHLPRDHMDPGGGGRLCRSSCSGDAPGPRLCSQTPADTFEFVRFFNLGVLLRQSAWVAWEDGPVVGIGRFGRRLPGERLAQRDCLSQRLDHRPNPRLLAASPEERPLYSPARTGLSSGDCRWHQGCWPLSAPDSAET
jgi:hypothetical protein